MRMRGHWGTSTLGLAMLTIASAPVASGVCFAQAERENQNQTQDQDRSGGQRTSQRSQSTQSVGAEHDAGKGMLQLILAMNQAEIKAAREAQGKLTNPQAREFAQKMIQDHTQFVQKLEQASGLSSEGASVAGTKARREQDRTAGQQAQDKKDNLIQPTSNPSQRKGTSGGTHDSLLTAVLDMGERRCEMVKQELQKKQGAEFDQCFMGAQLMAHFEALAALQTAQEIAPESARSVLAEGINTTQKHIEQAKQIAKTLDQSDEAKPQTQRSSDSQRSQQSTQQPPR